MQDFQSGPGPINEAVLFRQKEQAALAEAEREKQMEAKEKARERIEQRHFIITSLIAGTAALGAIVAAIASVITCLR